MQVELKKKKKTLETKTVDKRLLKQKLRKIMYFGSLELHKRKEIKDFPVLLPCYAK